MDKSKERPWYLINNVQDMDTPALVIYPERVRKNIEVLKAFIDDVSRLRPHVKTHKAPEATELLREAGISKFKCATIAEAEMLAQAHAKDVLLAYQPQGPKTDRLIALQKQYPSTVFSCLVDNDETGKQLSAKAVKARVVLPVFIDINVGMNRTGISPDKVLELYRNLRELPGLKVKGLHVYDGHIRHANISEREKVCDEAFQKVEQLRQHIHDRGWGDPIIIAGGSPTFPIHARRNHVECSPGTFIYWDFGYQQILKEQPFQWAALVVTRIISLPDKGLICTDLGHKSIASENDITKRVHFLNAPELTPVSQSEEHLVLRTNPDHTFRTGDILYGVPYHICPTVALYERAFIVENGQTTGEWKTAARDRKIFI
jgi:D-threonine aldolase